MPPPPRGGRGECPKKKSHIYMYSNVLVVFEVFWGGLGYFEAVGFQKRNLAHYMYGDGLGCFGKVCIICTVMLWWGWGWFWVVWGVSMDRTTAMLTDQIRKRVCLALIGSPTDSRTVLPRAVG